MEAPASRTPRIRVAAAIPVGSGVIVVRQHKGSLSYWLLPGGGVSWGESLAEALAREVKEEIGLEIAVDELLFVNDTVAPDGSKHLVNLTFLARAVSPVACAAPRDPAIDAVEIVAAEHLEGLDLRPPVARDLAQFLAHGHRPPAYLGPRWTPGAASSEDVARNRRPLTDT